MVCPLVPQMAQPTDTTRFIGRFLSENHAWMLVASTLLLLSTETLSLVPQAIMAALGIYHVSRNLHTVRQNKSFQVLLFLFLCLWLPQLISLIGAVNPARSAKIVLLYPLYLFCGIFIVRELARPGNLSRLSLALLIVVIFWCVDALVQYATGANLLGYPYQDGMLSGMFYPKLRLGIVVAVLVPVALETVRNVNRDSPVPLAAVDTVHRGGAPERQKKRVAHADYRLVGIPASGLAFPVFQGKVYHQRRFMCCRIAGQLDLFQES